VEEARWRERLESMLAEEKSLLDAAFAQTAAVARLVVPTRLPAGDSVAAIAAELAAGPR